MISSSCEKTTLTISPFSSPLLPSFTYFISFFSQYHTTGSAFHSFLSQGSFSRSSKQMRYHVVSTLFYKPLQQSNTSLSKAINLFLDQGTLGKKLSRDRKQVLEQTKRQLASQFYVSKVMVNPDPSYNLSQIPQGFHFINRKGITNSHFSFYQQPPLKASVFSDPDLLPIQYSEIYFQPDSWNGLDNYLFISQKSFAESHRQLPKQSFKTNPLPYLFQFVGWRESFIKSGINPSMVRSFQFPPGFSMGLKPYGLTYATTSRRYKRRVDSFYQSIQTPVFRLSPNFFSLSSSCETGWNRWSRPLHKQRYPWKDCLTVSTDCFTGLGPRHDLQPVGFNTFLFKTNVLESGLGPTKSFSHWQSPLSFNLSKFMPGKFDPNVQQARHNMKMSTVISTELQGFWFTLFLTRKQPVQTFSTLPSCTLVFHSKLHQQRVLNLKSLYQLHVQSSKYNKFPFLKLSSKWLTVLSHHVLFAKQGRVSQSNLNEKSQSCTFSLSPVDSRIVVRRLSVLYDRLLYSNNSTYLPTRLPWINFLCSSAPIRGWKERLNLQNRLSKRFASGSVSNVVWYFNSSPFHLKRVKRRYLSQTTFGVSIRAVLNHSTFFI